MIDPCCGALDLHKGAKAVAIFDVVFSIAELIAAMIYESGPITMLSSVDEDWGEGVGAIRNHVDPKKLDANYVLSITLLFGLCLVILRIVQLACSILLMYGVFERNYRKCEVWFIFSFLIVTLALLQVLFEAFLRDKVDPQHSEEPDTLRILIPGLEILLNWYLMWVVFAFMRELKKRMGGSSSDGEEGNNNYDEEGREMMNISGGGGGDRRAMKA